MSDRFKRQSFLGERSEEILASARVGLIGYGGGGSHVGQQLAHIGFKEFIVADPDVVEESNLNRLVGATAEDASHGTAKIDVAKRVINGVLPDAHVMLRWSNWEEAILELRTADVLIGCVDSFGQRVSLERFARRFQIPYIDIGMDVVASGFGFQIIGQVALSSSDYPCLRCLGIVDDERLQNEERARMYGEAGDKPQVVWPNGVLASTAVGLAVQLLTPWSGESKAVEYLEYDGNSGAVRRAPRLETILRRNFACSHYRANEVGDPLFAVRSPR